MDLNAFYLADHRLIGLAMVAALLLVSEIGFRVGARRRDAPDSVRTLVSGTGAATFGLLALLLGFALSMAIGRWDARRDIVIHESNAIGTLSLRAGLFEQPVRKELRSALLEYADARIRLGTAGDDLEAKRVAVDVSESLHAEMWLAVEQAGTSEVSPAKLTSLIGATNELIDLHELRLASIENHLPPALFFVLLSIGSAAIYFIAWSFGAAGHGGRLSIMIVGLLVGVVLMLIMDVNRPQRGAFSVGVATLERVESTISR